MLVNSMSASSGSQGCGVGVGVEGHSDSGPYLSHLDFLCNFVAVIWLLCNLFYSQNSGCTLLCTTFSEKNVKISLKSSLSKSLYNHCRAISPRVGVGVQQKPRIRSISLSGIGVDLAGIMGGRMARAESGSVPSGVEYGERCPLSSRLRGLGERRELPSGVRPGRKRIFGVFWRPQNALFCTYMI